MGEIRDYIVEIFRSIPTPGIMDILDILVVAYLLYRLLILLRNTSTIRIAKAILLFLVVTGLTGLVHMYALNFILKAVLEVGMIALVIMFQPELRRALDHLGGSTLQNLLAGKPNEQRMEEVIRQTAAACGSMSRSSVPWSNGCRYAKFSRRFCANAGNLSSCAQPMAACRSVAFRL